MEIEMGATVLEVKLGGAFSVGGGKVAEPCSWSSVKNMPVPLPGAVLAASCLL